MLQGPAFVYAQEVCAVWLSGSSLRCSLPLADALTSVLVSDTGLQATACCTSSALQELTHTRS